MQRFVHWIYFERHFFVAARLEASLDCIYGLTVPAKSGEPGATGSGKPTSFSKR